MRFVQLIAITLFSLCLATAGWAQSSEAGAAPDGFSVLFNLGSSNIRTDQEATLDQAARTFRAGNPVVMIIAGSADTVGDPSANLDLSVRRARSVADGLVARGIPIQRLQVVGRGNSELPVPTEYGIANEANRSVSITWR